MLRSVSVPACILHCASVSASLHALQRMFGCCTSTRCLFLAIRVWPLIWALCCTIAEVLPALVICVEQLRVCCAAVLCSSVVLSCSDGEVYTYLSLYRSCCADSPQPQFCCPPEAC
jgi:hypothetical protein